MVKGFFFDGKNSSKTQATFSVDSGGRYHLDTVSDVNGLFSEIKVSSRIGNTARYLAFPNGSQFETLDNDAIDILVRKFSGQSSAGLIHKLESTKVIIISTLVTMIVFSWLFIQFGVPHFSRQIAMMLPEDVPRLLGQGVLESMDKHMLSPSELDDSRQKELQDLFNKLKTKTRGAGFTNLELRKGNRVGANAFALPDGTIVFTDEIIALADNLQEIEAIMFHELGHIKYRHAIRSVIQQFSLALFVMVVTGDVSTSSSLITALPVVLVEAGYSQDMEWEADTFALSNMILYSVDPVHFANIMTRLEESHRKTGNSDCNKEDKAKDCEQHTASDKKSTDEKSLMDYLSTHPPTAQRIERFRQSSQQ